MNTTRARQVRLGTLTISTVIREGTGSGIPLLLCNGIGAHHETLRPFADAMDPSLTSVRFDVPGVGSSSVPAFPAWLPLVARTARRMMDGLGYDQFDVLGISWGGALAQQIALQYPRRCRRMVLAATATGSLMVPARPAVLRHLITPGRYKDPNYARSVARVIYGGMLRERPELAEQLLVRADRPPSQRGYLYQLLAGAGWTSLPLLPVIRQPTLLLAGTDDPIIPLVNARLMRALLPNARLHTYDDGHLALVTSARDLAPVVSRFLMEP